MARVAALPQAKAVVVLHGDYHHFHSGAFHGLAPLVGIERLEVEYFRVFVTRAPFHAGKGVGPEVNKGYKFVFESAHLVGCRHHMGCLFHYHLFRIAGIDGDGVGKVD